MGGCISCCYSCCNNCKSEPNPYQLRIKHGGAQSVEVDKGEGYVVRRHPAAKDLSLDALNAMYTKEYPTMLHFISTAVANHGAKTAYATRKIVKTEKEKQPNGKELEVYHMGAREGTTFRRMFEQICGFAGGLKKLGIEPGHKIALYEETRAEWIMSAYGIWFAGAVPVTVYANLGEDALIYALKESEVDTVVCNGKAVGKLQKLCAGAGIKLKTIIYTDELAAGQDEQNGAACSSWNSVVDSGIDIADSVEKITTKTEDLAVIMYTSGTTGDPKGVVLTQGNVVSAVQTIGSRLGESVVGVVDPTYCAYLPLAHILEFAAENFMYSCGFTVCYGNPRTLSDAVARPHGDLSEYKPVILAGVPRVFDNIRKVVETKLPSPGSLRRTVFDRAFQERRDAIRRGETTPVWNDKVFSATAARLGGRVKWIVSGGAPLSAKTQEWLATVFACFVGQGYGLTETGAATTVQNYWDFQTENTGGLLPCCEVKLRDADIYKVTDPLPRGEVLIRGPNVAQGYYKQEDKTKEAFLPDGFFATGDVGEFQADGTLKIVGRVKALAKNAHGEYIAMEALESMYVQNDLVLPNGICVLVDSHQPFIVAVALTDESKAMTFAKSKNIEGTYPAILKDPKFIDAAVESMTKTAKDNGRKPFEFLKNIRFYADEWTPENGILTAAMKLKRREIDAKYGEDIKQMIEEKAEKVTSGN